MKNDGNTKRSNGMKKVWAEQRERMMSAREVNSVETKAIQSAKIKQHYSENPEHKEAISIAQKAKWVKYKRALTYCINAGINLGDDML